MGHLFYGNPSGLITLDVLAPQSLYYYFVKIIKGAETEALYFFPVPFQQNCSILFHLLLVPYFNASITPACVEILLKLGKQRLETTHMSIPIPFFLDLRIHASAGCLLFLQILTTTSVTASLEGVKVGEVHVQLPRVRGRSAWFCYELV